MCSEWGMPMFGCSPSRCTPTHVLKDGCPSQSLSRPHPSCISTHAFSSADVLGCAPWHQPHKRIKASIAGLLGRSATYVWKSGPQNIHIFICYAVNTRHPVWDQALYPRILFGWVTWPSLFRVMTFLSFVLTHSTMKHFTVTTERSWNKEPWTQTS